MALPDGSVVIPPGCNAPDRLDAYPDSWLGSIECTPGPSIFVFGSAMAADACPRSGAAPHRGTQLVSAKGHKLEVCATERKAAGSGKVIKEMVVGTGATSFRAEIREPADAVMLLFIATTFE
jgi:hypothetical protein